MTLKDVGSHRQIEDDCNTANFRPPYRSYRNSIGIIFLLLFLLAWVCSSLIVLSSSLEDETSFLRGRRFFARSAVSGDNADDKISQEEPRPPALDKPAATEQKSIRSEVMKEVTKHEEPIKPAATEQEEV